MYRIVQGDLEAEEWHELALDSVMANFIHLDAIVDSDTRDPDTMLATKVSERDEAVNIAKKHKAPSGPPPRCGS
ncbi:hypothetical protein FIBSPDRAFT_947943 [Athelia psychrophila]|uniref:Uncharacterized protein n=1 Tax=Athelia psychrophila TaxID=1759441 RepID=A0A166R946_9AGAM|nr:hypothetical protein FIBSPDRAFT_947943 [Fibularhizoctonia sp. CBS 109695]